MSNLTSNYFSLGFFLFDSSDEGISENYDRHAKRAIRRHLNDLINPLPSDALSGDILLGITHVRVNVQNIFSANSCRTERVDTALLASLKNGESPGYIPYALGIFGVSLSKLLIVDDRLKQDAIAGYRGLAMFAMNDIEHVMELGSGLSLPLSKLS